MKASVLILSFIIASRFFALFIVLPVISLYAQKLSGASAISVGLIVGIYAIFQMVFSLPFGALSDVIGRKNAMLLGLVIFIIGSLICANASDIYMMLLGRSLQGTGAIGGVATAMIADLTSDKDRSKAMAMMGASIGLSFAAAMMIGPALAHYAGLASLFYFSAALSVLAGILLFVLPKQQRQDFRKSVSLSDISRVLHSYNLCLLYLTNFLQKGLAAAIFMLIPLSFVQIYAQNSADLYKLYASAMVLGFVAMGAGGVVGESKGKSKLILLSGIVLFCAANLCFYEGRFGFFLGGVFAFFVGFCLHEPIMQSSLSKICPSSLKGTVLGLSNACGYLGSFLGPLLCAYCLHNGHIMGFLLAAAIVCVLWFVLLLKLENPNDFKVIHLGWGVNISSLKVADSGQDKDGLWVKINLKKYPLEYIKDKIGVQISGASAPFKGGEYEKSN